MSIIILDTETTGLLLPSSVPIDEQPHIIEIGALKVDKGGNVIDTINQLINPLVEISEKITKITGITNEDVKRAPKFCHMILVFQEFFKDAETIICHNASFDIGMLKVELQRCKVKTFNIPDDIICTVQEYTPAFNKRPSLKVLYNKVMGTPLKQTHRALDDAVALNEILTKDRFFDKLKGEGHY